MQPTALIIRTAGTNCDRELIHAFELAGARTHTVHLNQLIADPALLEQGDLIGFPGGFSYGDDIAAGRIFANRLRQRLLEPLRAAIDRGVPMIGICNGFQVLVKAGLLPFPHADSATPGDGAASGGSGTSGGSGGGGRQHATLADNTCGRFIDRWVPLRAEADSVCIWTRGLGDIDLPIAHGEGRFVPAGDDVLNRLREGKQVALRYRQNPNGSVDDIAGICDPTGLVFGLMPHPERFTHPTHHPAWTRRGDDFLKQTTPGLRIFQNAVNHARTNTPLATATSE